MSTDAATQFLAKVADDAALQTQAKAIGEGGQDVAAAAVALGAAHGFEFTAKEFADIVNEVRQSDELADKHLEGVAGGAAFVKYKAAPLGRAGSLFLGKSPYIMKY